MESPDKTFAPFNDNINTNPDRKFIVGPYSTFDQNLSRLDNQPISKWEAVLRKAAALRGYKRVNVKKNTRILEEAAKRIKNKKLFKFTENIADMFLSFICRDETRRRMIEFDSMTDDKRLKFAQDIIDHMTQEINKLGANMPKIPVEFDKDISEMSIYYENEIPNPVNTCIKINPVIYRNDVVRLCVSLSHEFVHLVDMFSPNMSPLGAQVVHIAFKYYLSQQYSEECYNNNPTEINAYCGIKYFTAMVQQIKDLPLDQPASLVWEPFHQPPQNIIAAAKKTRD